MLNPGVDQFMASGCGRCPLGNTPGCKVHRWTGALALLRQYALDCGLSEEVKWGVPCYTLAGKNVLVLGVFNAFCSISFFQGALMQQEPDLLEKPGENTQAARLIRFTDAATVAALEPRIKNCIREAIEIEKEGRRASFPAKDALVWPDVFLGRMNQEPALKAAVEALTPGRKRAWLLFFTAPKQEKTRLARIEKSLDAIFAGKGPNDY